MFKTNLSKTILFMLVPLYCCAQPKLEFPVECIEGEDCWVVNYVDVAPETNSVKDFNCGLRSYDDHKGTDIAIRDRQTMEYGVDVLAAADGTVLRIRDGVEDTILSRDQLYIIKKENKSCGNGVFIEHGDGWQTIYCHLKKNSTVVKPNQTVKAGQKLGQVGHSGYVEFPHLHIGVMHNESLIDPYTGLSNQEGCNNSNQKQAEKTSQSLWAEEAHANYSHVSIYVYGLHLFCNDNYS
jgi:peptidase M23-like protein